jgi:hypothetical protein
MDADTKDAGYWVAAHLQEAIVHVAHKSCSPDGSHLMADVPCNLLLSSEYMLAGAARSALLDSWPLAVVTAGAAVRACLSAPEKQGTEAVQGCCCWVLNPEGVCVCMWFTP